MSSWFYKVTADPTDLSPLVECLDYYEEQYQEARKDLRIIGRVEHISSRIPGLAEQRWAQLQELEALLRHMDDEFKRVKVAAFKKYLETYNKALSSRDAEKYAEADPKVLEMSYLHNQVALMRNKFMGVFKGLETLQFQINNIVKLRCAGLEDSEIDY